MPTHEEDILAQVDAQLNALSTPTSSQVFYALTEFSPRHQVAAAARVAKAGGGGGSQPWTEHDLLAPIANWTDDGAGTWTETGGVISQTNDTADSYLQYNTDLPSVDYVIEAEVRFPTGQDSGTTMQAVIVAGSTDGILAGNTNVSSAYGEGAMLVGDASGDGAGIQVMTWVDGQPPAFAPNAIPTAIVQGDWHTLRAFVSPVRQVVYIDGTLVCAGETVSGGNAPGPQDPGSNGLVDKTQLGAVGLVDFRNVKVWTRPLPA